MFNPPNPKEYNAIVWKIVKQIPEGKVSSYGQIASMIPPPDGSDPDQYSRLGARWVGSAMRATPNGSGVPWQRVINSQGMISFPAGSAIAEKQRQMLEQEGIEFNERDKVNFKVYGWHGPDEDWLEQEDLFPPKILK